MNPTTAARFTAAVRFSSLEAAPIIQAASALLVKHAEYVATPEELQAAHKVLLQHETAGWFDEDGELMDLSSWAYLLAAEVVPDGHPNAYRFNLNSEAESTIQQYLWEVLTAQEGPLNEAQLTFLSDTGKAGKAAYAEGQCPLTFVKQAFSTPLVPYTPVQLKWAIELAGAEACGGDCSRAYELMKQVHLAFQKPGAVDAMREKLEDLIKSVQAGSPAASRESVVADIMRQCESVAA